MKPLMACAYDRFPSLQVETKPSTRPMPNDNRSLNRQE